MNVWIYGQIIHFKFLYIPAVLLIRIFISSAFISYSLIDISTAVTGYTTHNSTAFSTYFLMRVHLFSVITI